MYSTRMHFALFSLLLGSGKTVLIVRLSQSTQIYHGGSYCVQLRVPEGSAVVTLESHNGMIIYMYMCCYCIFSWNDPVCTQDFSLGQYGSYLFLADIQCTCTCTCTL